VRRGKIFEKSSFVSRLIAHRDRSYLPAPRRSREKPAWHEPIVMATYEDIKSAAVRIRNEPASSEGIKHLAEVAIALCDRLAELESRHETDLRRLENWGD